MGRLILVIVAILLPFPTASQSLLEGGDDIDYLGTLDEEGSFGYDEHMAYIAAQFRTAGCNEYKVSLVAELEAEAEEIYVAWCAAADNYFMVMRCKYDLCNMMRKSDEFGDGLGGDGLGGFDINSDMETLP